MNWRALVAVAVFVATVATAVLLLRPTEPVAVETVQPVSRPRPAPAIAAPRPPLGRAEIIAAAARAADTYARGQPASPANVALAGRRFALRLPFGCGGPADVDGDDWASWSYDEEEGTLRASVTPEVWTDVEFVRAIAGPAEFEAAEGFWVSRPWITVDECPAVPAPLDREEATPLTEAPASPQPTATAESQPALQPPAARGTLALVEFFAPGSRRAERRNGRPYRIVADLPPTAIDLNRGLRLHVEGRLAPLQEGQPIACRSESVNVRPVCLVSIEVARIAITDATGERQFAEWTQ